MNDLIQKANTMYLMWDKAEKYDNLLKSAHRHVKKYGLIRLYFSPRFVAIRARMKRYEAIRIMCIKIAIDLGKQLKQDWRGVKYDIFN